MKKYQFFIILAALFLIDSDVCDGFKLHTGAVVSAIVAVSLSICGLMFYYFKE